VVLTEMVYIYHRNVKLSDVLGEGGLKFLILYVSLRESQIGFTDTDLKRKVVAINRVAKVVKCRRILFFSIACSSDGQVL